MAIRVQCEKCGSVMNIREAYAGTERSCPKCHAKFKVPEAGTPEASGGGGAPATTTEQGDDFDPIAFLTGEASKKGGAPPKGDATKKGDKKKESPKPPAGAPPKPAEFDPLDVLGGAPAGKTAEKPASTTAKGKPAEGPKPPAGQPPKAEPDFDPLDVLGGGPAGKAPDKAAPVDKPAQAPSKGKSAETAKPAPAAAAPPAKEAEFDPLDVLGGGKPPAPAAPPPSAAPAAPAPTEPEPYKPKRPSWAKPPAEDKPADAAPAADAGAAPKEEAPKEPEPYKPRRPSWAKPLAEEKPEEGAAPAAAAGEPEPYKPKRPSWAKPEPVEQQPAAAVGTEAAPVADTSPAALAAAAAMVGPVQGSLPPEPPPRRPWIDREALVEGIKRRARMIAITIPIAAALFGLSWLIIRPGSVSLPDVVPVSGQVTQDGKPVEGARVIFHPRTFVHRSPEAVTDADGRYTLMFWEGNEGAPPGRYRVQVEKIGEDGRDTIPPQFGQASRKDEVVGPDGATIDVKIDLKPAAR